MLAVLYLCVCAITGMVLVSICVPDVRRLYLACAPSLKAIENIPSTLFVVAAGTVTGMMCVPFVNYFVVLALSYFVASDKLCIKIGLMVTAALFFWLVLSCLILANKKRIKKEESGEGPVSKLPTYVNKPSNTLFYSAVILITTIVSAFLMFYTYRIDRGYLLNGYSTFSDLSPHTAMVSSFGKGFNFPTEYMHFSGDGIKYHFMFYFLAGMLERLGLPIDYALNIPSIVSMVCTLILLGLLASLLSGRRLAFALAPVLVFFRSSLNVFIHIQELMAGGSTLPDAISEIMVSNTWYGVTEYDSWGVWAINVYPNQRHLMLGVGALLVCIILFIPFVRRLCISAMSAGSVGGAFKAILFSKNAWVPRTDDPLSAGTVALFTCIIVIVMPYFHGSCLIALLLVLFGMALVSESRLLHLMVAVCAVVSSFLQTLAFSGGAQNVVNMKFIPGFILSETSKTITGNVLVNWGNYLLIVTGATLLAAGACTIVLLLHDLIKKKPVYRFFLMLAFLNPMVFAFFFQVTREMLANHKFIQISIILADVFVAIFLANLIIVPGRRKAVAVAAAGVDAAAGTGVDDGDDDENENEDEKDDSEETAALEAHIEKAAEDGELAPVIPTEKKPEEIHFGDEDKSDEEEPFEVLTDSDDKPEEEPSDDSEDNDAKEEEKETGSESVSESESESGDEDEPVEVETSDDADDSDDADVAFVSEEKKDDSSSERSLEKTPADPALTKKLSFNGETIEEDEDEKTSEEDLPFEVIDDDNDSGKALVEEDDIDIEESDEDDEDDEEDMILEHLAVTEGKSKGLPQPVWVIFEIFGILASIILFVFLIGTGISEWATYININSTPMAINTNSPVTEWIVKNTEPDDVFLTPEWSMDRFLLAGRPMYYGWPYYAWSAGHDTDKRDTIYLWLISGCGGDIKEFKRYCKERGIRYLIADPEFEEGDYGEDVFFNREFFEENLQQVAYFTEEKTIIYKIY